MKTLITYCTSHGCTEKTARELKEYLQSDVDLCNLKKDNLPPLQNYERIIIGGSIHAGKIQKRVKDFCNTHFEALTQKELGLFICCMEEGEKAERQLQDAYPEELRQQAKAAAYFGGEFNFNKMNFFEKMIVKKVAHVNQSTSSVNHLSIQNFSKRMDKIFNPFLFLA